MRTVIELQATVEATQGRATITLGVATLIANILRHVSKTVHFCFCQNFVKCP